MITPIVGDLGAGVIVGANVREVRQSRGWSQVTLGQKAGLRQGYISAIERGERCPSLDYRFVGGAGDSAFASALPANIDGVFRFLAKGLGGLADRRSSGCVDVLGQVPRGPSGWPLTAKQTPLADSGRLLRAKHWITRRLLD
jgi:hypothetical protein